jgi:hypothetical protein
MAQTANNEESGTESNTEASADSVIFRLHGIDHDDLPDGICSVGERGYPKDGYDHEAHHAATVVMDALKDEFEWAEEVTGVSMG